MQIRKLFTTVSLSLILGVGLVVATGPKPAFAAYSDCGVGLFCAWDGTNGTGTRWDMPYSVYGHGCWVLGSANNLWSSAWNRYGSGQYVTLFDYGPGCLGSGQWVGNLSNGDQRNMTAAENNVISLFQVLP